MIHNFNTSLMEFYKCINYLNNVFMHFIASLSMYDTFVMIKLRYDNCISMCLQDSFNVDQY